MWIQRALLERVIDYCSKDDDLRIYGWLYLFSYCFLLRLPSEALPVQIGTDGLHTEGDTIVLILAKRWASHFCAVALAYRW